MLMGEQNASKLGRDSANVRDAALSGAGIWLVRSSVVLSAAFRDSR
jgi:hypothetical protein